VARVRNSARALAVVAGAFSTVTVFVAALAAPAYAVVPDTAYDAGPGLTVTETIGIFVGIPLLIILVIYALVYGLTGRRGPRYPAGQPWTAEPEVFGDRATGPDAAATGESTGDTPTSQAEGGARGQW
jgi:hypothetical protein